MKKILLSTVAFATMTASAMAADLPRRAVAPAAPFVAVPVFTWTGFYVGVNAGYGFANNNNDEAIFAPRGTFAAAGPGFAATNGTFFNGGDGGNDGFLGGAQVGYNMQFGMFVVGVEADIQAIDLNNNNNNGFATFVGAGPLPNGFVLNSGTSGLDYFGTVRARLGVAFGRTMVYGTGGFAFGGGDNNNNGFFGNNNNNDSRGGYAVGGGIEHAFTNNLTAKIEGLYVNLDRNGNNNVIGTDGAGRIYTVSDRNSRDNDFGLVRVGVNFKF